MAEQPWKTNDWFVSEWNYAPEVTKDFKFAKNIKIHDVTLRDGEQQTGVILSKDEKIRIAEADGMLAERRDTVVAPFTGPLAHLFARLDAWAVEQREALRAEIKTLVGL